MERRKGFTLVELLIVIVIVGLLSLIAVPRLIEAFNKSADKVMHVQESEVLHATDVYRQDYCGKTAINKTYRETCNTERQNVVATSTDTRRQVYFCLNSVVDKNYITSPAYKGKTPCNGIIVYDYNSSDGSYLNGKTYLYCQDGIYHTKGYEPYVDLINTCPGVTAELDPTDPTPDPTPVAPTEYTVTFNTDGGSTIASQRVTSGGLATRPENPTKSASSFVDWYDSSAKTNLFNFNTPITSNVTVYAKWETSKVLVYYTLQPGETLLEELNGKHFKSVNGIIYSDNCPSIQPGPDGYCPLVSTILHGGQTHAAGLGNPDSHGGTMGISKNGVDARDGAVVGQEWMCASGNCKKTTYNKATVYSADDFCNTDNGDCSVQVKVNWKNEPEPVIIYTVSFNTDGGSAVSSQSVESGNKATRPSPNPTKTGYRFGNWYTTSAKTTTFNFNTSITENTVIYAKWNVCPNSEGVKTWDTSAECMIAACNTGYRLNGNQCLQNNVTIKYKLGTGETISGGSIYSINTDRFVTKNGSIFTTTTNYGEQIGSSGLADYNNVNYINILKPGYKAVSGSEWVNIADSSKKYSQSINYNSNDFCDAGANNCEVSLQVNWVACTNNSNVATWKANNNCEINTCNSGYTLKDGKCEKSSCTMYCTGNAWTGGSPGIVSCSRTHDTSVLFPAAEYECVNGVIQEMKNCWYGSHRCTNSVMGATNLCTMPAFNNVSVYSACNTGSGTIHGLGLNEHGGYPCNCDKWGISYDLYTLPEGSGLIDWPNSQQAPSSYIHGGEPVTIDGERYPPTHRDYTFAGWSEGSSSEVSRKITISPSETGDKNFKAHWCQNYIKINHGYKTLDSISPNGTCNYNIGCNDGYRVSGGGCKK